MNSVGRSSFCRDPRLFGACVAFLHSNSLPLLYASIFRSLVSFFFFIDFCCRMKSIYRVARCFVEFKNRARPVRPIVDARNLSPNDNNISIKPPKKCLPSIRGCSIFDNQFIRVCLRYKCVNSEWFCRSNNYHCRQIQSTVQTIIFIPYFLFFIEECALAWILQF